MIRAVARRAPWLGALCWLVSCGADPSRPDATARTPAPLVVQRGALDDRHLLTGEIEAATAENLVVPRTPTWVASVRWLIEDGARVKRGDRLVSFDTTAFVESMEDRRSAVLRADSELASETAQAAVTVAEKTMEVERKRLGLEKARLEASVPADLYPRRLHQEKQLAVEQARDALTKAAEDLQAQRRAAQLERSVKEVARVRARREYGDLQKRLEELTLRAPRDGIVQIATNRNEGRKFLVGDQAFPGWVVVSMPDLGALQVRARLMDVDDGAVREGMAAEGVLDAYPRRRFGGMVRTLSPVARQEGRDTARRFFDVIVSLDGAEPGLMQPGMSVRVEVIRRRLADTVVVPRAALPRWPGPSEVRLTGGATRPVDVAFCTALACAVQGDLAAGTALLPAVPVGQGAR